MAEEEKVEVPPEAQAILAQLSKIQEPAGITGPPEEPEKPEPVVCKRCGCICTEEPLKPTEEERREYLRCILGGNMYVKKYNLFDGAITVSFGSLSNDEADRMGVVLGQLDRSMPPLKLQAEAVKIKLLYYLEGLGSDAYESPTEEAVIGDVYKLYKKRFGHLSEDYMTILIRAYQEFYQLIGILTNSGFDSGFWAGAGLI